MAPHCLQNWTDSLAWKGARCASSWSQFSERAAWALGVLNGRVLWCLLLSGSTTIAREASLTCAVLLPTAAPHLPPFHPSASLLAFWHAHPYPGLLFPLHMVFIYNVFICFFVCLHHLEDRDSERPDVWQRTCCMYVLHRYLLTVVITVGNSGAHC